MELDELFAIVEKAQEGDSSAQYRLGDCFYNGIGVNIDYQKAAFWFEKAAEQENVDAQHMFGFCYFSGNGFEKDYEKAKFWFKKAADKGNELSQQKLALLYEDEHDYENAAYWYRKLGEHGSDFLSKSVAFAAFANGLDGVLEKDYKQALLLAVKAIETIPEKHIKVKSYLFTYLGNVYKNGINLKKDYEKAIYWYTKAAEAGNLEAQTYLSKILNYGENR